MKRKKWLISAAVMAGIALLGLLGIGGYAVYDYVFTMAAPIFCPNEEDIASILLTQSNDSSTAIEISDFGNILQSIHNTQPTRIWSVQDYPAAENYYTIEIKTSEWQDRYFRYFVYTEDSQVYLESPYEGVYEADQQFLDFLEKFFKD